jgi:molybdenum cofactor cytidylyltransferase
VISAVILANRADQLTLEPNIFLLVKGKPILQWVLETVLASNLDEIVCVTRELRSVRKQISIVSERLLWLAPGEGADAGVVAGLWATNPKSEGVLFLAGNHPLVRKELINALVARFCAGSALIVAPSFGGKARDPLLVHRDLFPELLQLSGKRSLHTLLQEYRNKVALVEWPDEIAFLDLEVREDFERIKELA